MVESHDSFTAMHFGSLMDIFIVKRKRTAFQNEKERKGENKKESDMKSLCRYGKQQKNTHNVCKV